MADVLPEVLGELSLSVRRVNLRYQMSILDVGRREILIHSHLRDHFTGERSALIAERIGDWQLFRDELKSGTYGLSHEELSRYYAQVLLLPAGELYQEPEVREIYSMTDCDRSKVVELLAALAARYRSTPLSMARRLTSLESRINLVDVVMGRSSEFEAQLPERDRSRPRCRASRTNGNPCRAWPLPGTPFCYAHKGYHALTVPELIAEQSWSRDP